MKFTFAAACLLIVTLADQKFTLADDRGLDKNNVTTTDIREGLDGWINYIFLWISKKDLYDETIFKGSNGVVFNVGVLGQWPEYNDQYEVTLEVDCADGTVIEQSDNGNAAAELKNIRLEADTTSCDITNVTVTMIGRSIEYWAAGNYGTLFKDMDLYVWNDSEVEDMFSGLNQTHVIDDHVWTNEDGYIVEPEHCFDIVSVTSEQTVEFVAYSSTPANDDKAHYFAADIELYRLTKDGEIIEIVADSVSAEADGGATLANQSTLFYDQKVDKDTFYQLCFVWDHPEVEDNESIAQAGSYQYGYHIYDEDYKPSEHHADSDE